MIMDISHADLEVAVEWTDVESSQIARVALIDVDGATLLGWNAIDPATGEPWAERPEDTSFLLVEFKTKEGAPPSLYAYRGASDEDFDMMVDPDGSAGRYLHAAIKPTCPFFKLRAVEEYGAPDETPA